MIDQRLRRRVFLTERERQRAAALAIVTSRAHDFRVLEDTLDAQWPTLTVERLYNAADRDALKKWVDSSLPAKSVATDLAQSLLNAASSATATTAIERAAAMHAGRSLGRFVAAGSLSIEKFDSAVEIASALDGYEEFCDSFVTQCKADPGRCHAWAATLSKMPISPDAFLEDYARPIRGTIELPASLTIEDIWSTRFSASPIDRRYVSRLNVLHLVSVQQFCLALEGVQFLAIRKALLDDMMIYQDEELLLHCVEQAPQVTEGGIWNGKTLKLLLLEHALDRAEALDRLVAPGPGNRSSAAVGEPERARMRKDELPAFFNQLLQAIADRPDANFVLVHFGAQLVRQASHGAEVWNVTCLALDQLTAFAAKYGLTLPDVRDAWRKEKERLKHHASAMSSYMPYLLLAASIENDRVGGGSIPNSICNTLWKSYVTLLTENDSAISAGVNPFGGSRQ